MVQLLRIPGGDRMKKRKSEPKQGRESFSRKIRAAVWLFRLKSASSFKRSTTSTSAGPFYLLVNKDEPNQALQVSTTGFVAKGAVQQKPPPCRHSKTATMRPPPNRT